MVLPGEIFGGDGYCTDCKIDLPLGVYQSAAGYYVGTFCSTCGPYSRESGYYGTREKAAKALKDGAFFRV